MSSPYSPNERAPALQAMFDALCRFNRGMEDTDEEAVERMMLAMIKAAEEKGWAFVPMTALEHEAITDTPLSRAFSADTPEARVVRSALSKISQVDHGDDED